MHAPLDRRGFLQVAAGTTLAVAGIATAETKEPAKLKKAVNNKK